MATGMKLELTAREVSEYIAGELNKGKTPEPFAGVLSQACVYLLDYVKVQEITGGIEPDSDVLELRME